MTIATTLIQDGNANVNQANAAGVVPLLIASMGGHTSVVELLLNAGAERNRAESGGGATPLMASCAAGHTATAAALLRNGGDTDRTVDQANLAGMTALLFAIQKVWAVGREREGGGDSVMSGEHAVRIHLPFEKVR
jgi:ankyrin repeat protein